MTDTDPSTRSKRSLTGRAPTALVAVADETGAPEWLTRKRTENILREALRSRWGAPTEESVRFQMARLEQMIVKLRDRIRNDDLEAIDRALRIAERVRRYYELASARGIARRYGEDDRARLMGLIEKLNELADSLQPEKPAE